VSYGITVNLAGPFAPTVARVRAALAEQGFGVPTESTTRGRAALDSLLTDDGR